MSMKSVVRNAVYAAEKRMQSMRFASLAQPALGWPILLGISFPKSGTHLLDQILLGFSKVAPFSLRLHSFYAEYEGATGRKRGPQQARAWLDSLTPRDVASAHLFSRPEALERVLNPEFLAYFVFRDPRDVAVSHAFYITEMASDHAHHDYYASLPDFDSRLTASIVGRSGIEIEFPDIAARFEPYAGWLQHAQVLKVHFEDLVNDRPRTLGMILDHFLLRVPLAAPRAQILDALEIFDQPRTLTDFSVGEDWGLAQVLHS